MFAKYQKRRRRIWGSSFSLDIPAAPILKRTYSDAVSILRGPESRNDRAKKKTLVSTDQRLSLSTLPGGIGHARGRGTPRGMAESS